MRNILCLLVLCLLGNFLTYANTPDNHSLRDKHFETITTLDNTLLEYEHRQRNGYPLSIEGKLMRQQFHKEDTAITKLLDFYSQYINYPTSEYYKDAKGINRKLVDRLFDSYFTKQQATELRARVLDKGDSIASIYAITLIVEHVSQNRQEATKVLQEVFISDGFVNAYQKVNISFKRQVDLVNGYYIDRQVAN